MFSTPEGCQKQRPVFIEHLWQPPRVGCRGTVPRGVSLSLSRVEQIVAEEMRRSGWTEAELPARRRSDPAKPAIAGPDWMAPSGGRRQRQGGVWTPRSIQMTRRRVNGVLRLWASKNSDLRYVL